MNNNVFIIMFSYYAYPISFFHQLGFKVISLNFGHNWSGKAMYEVCPESIHHAL